MTPIQSANLAKPLKPYDLFWLKDCTPADNQEALRLVRQQTTTPLAIGEVFNTKYEYQQLIREQSIAYVRSAVTHTVGISHLKKTLDCASQHQIRSGKHRPTDISPVGMAAASHLGLTIDNFGNQENMRYNPDTPDVFQTSYTFKNGQFHPGDAPSIGVELDVESAVKVPYVQAYLPVNRLLDGIVHDW